MKIILDSIENNWAVAELPDGQTISLPALLFPGAEEGDVFIIEKDMRETERRRKRIRQKMERLFVD